MCLLWTRIRRTEVSVSHSHRTAGGRTEERQKTNRRETGEDETKHNRREDTRGHRPRQRTWKRRDDRGDMMRQWWWWWDNRRTTEDNRGRGQDREVKREDRDGDMTRTKQEDQLYLMRTTTNWRHKTRNDTVEDTRQQWDNMKTDKKQMDDMRQKHETTVRTGRRGR